MGDNIAWNRQPVTLGVEQHLQRGHAYIQVCVGHICDARLQETRCYGTGELISSLHECSCIFCQNCRPAG